MVQAKVAAPPPGEVHDVGLKAAETDATKRALITFGKPFGLELYRSPKTAAIPKNITSSQPAGGEPRLGFHPDDTTPIPRPSRYYGRRHSSTISEDIRGKRSSAEQMPAAPPLAPTAPLPDRIDKSLLTLAEPKRRRDKSHLRFVASQPCLVCGRQPSDPHHLRFTQPRALGLKVSDEFTVPLCRSHHRQLHQVGNEKSWWANLGIEPMEIAKQLWEKSHPLPDTTSADAINEEAPG